MPDFRLQSKRQKRKLIISKIIIPIIVILFVILFGSLWYSLVEHWSFLDSLYMTVITVTTIGFGEVRNLDDSGKTFTIIIALLGAGAVAYALSSFISIGVGGQLFKIIKGKQMYKEIKFYNNHVILCGCGKMGECVLVELLARGKNVIVIENDPVLCESLYQYKIPVIQDDATSEDVLLKARIKEAHSLITVLTSDADNLFLTLTARELSSDLFIIARCLSQNAGRKLMRAGANKVILSNEIAGKHMANILLIPEAMNFVDEITGMKNREFGLREIRITKKCEWLGKTIAEADLRAITGLNVLAIYKSGHGLVINPSPSTKMEDRDMLIVFGVIKDAEELNHKFYNIKDDK